MIISAFKQSWIHTIQHNRLCNSREVLLVGGVCVLEEELGELLAAQHYVVGHHVHVLRKGDIGLAVRLDRLEDPLRDGVERVVLNEQEKKVYIMY